MRGLWGKRIIIAGGANGIGAAVARRLAEEGAKLVVGDIDSPALENTIADIKADGGQAHGVHFDLNDEASARELARSCINEYGGVDGLANIGRAPTPPRDLLDASNEDWETQFGCNVGGYARTIKAVIPHMSAQKSGSIVNTSSVAAFGGDPDRPVYSAAKAAINALTRSVARRWGPDNVRCNGVTPGLVLSESQRKRMPEAQQMATAKLAALRRNGEPASVAPLYAFLLSDDADWVTGQVWSINGGLVLRE